MVSLADLNNDLRLAVDTGSVALGTKETEKAVSGSKAKLVVVTSKGEVNSINDIMHLCNVAGVKVVRFKGSSMELGTVCGKPYSINSLAVIEPGNSKILNGEY
ncbi:MAG: 50S ribosomal protein L30e [Candidatus Micrarchaeota archaeon]|nr:50S ribosomal protein L30e [Candidatus Micrarchaeota archaeon]